MATRTTQYMTIRTGMDLNILRSTEMDGTTPGEFGFDAKSTKAVGLAKLRNKVCKLLWTKKGSNPINLNEGTNLPDLYLYSITDKTSVLVAVQEALSSALAQIQEIQNTVGAKAEERLTALELVDLSVTFEGTKQMLHITISIYSAAGENATFELPSAVA